MFSRLLGRITKTDPHKLSLYRDIYKDMLPYILPFMHKDRQVSRNIFISYGYLLCSKLCFFGGPFLLKSGIDAIRMGAAVDPLPMLFGYGLCYCGSVFFEALRNVKGVELSNLAVKDISHKSLRHILTLDPEFFFMSSQTKTLSKLNRAMKSL
jgi:ABC-type bacteriocin/lantibiotic exporter with double-glycine peptidase domain